MDGGGDQSDVVLDTFVPPGRLVLDPVWPADVDPGVPGGTASLDCLPSAGEVWINKYTRERVVVEKVALYDPWYGRVLPYWKGAIRLGDVVVFFRPYAGYARAGWYADHKSRSWEKEWVKDKEK